MVILRKVERAAGPAGGGSPSDQQLRSAFDALGDRRAGLVLAYGWASPTALETGSETARMAAQDLRRLYPETFAETEWVFGHRIKGSGYGRVDFVLYLFADKCD